MPNFIDTFLGVAVPMAVFGLMIAIFYRAFHDEFRALWDWFTGLLEQEQPSGPTTKYVRYEP